MKPEQKAFVEKLKPRTACDSCESVEVVVRIGGRNYCEHCSDQGYSRSIFVVMAGDD